MIEEHKNEPQDSNAGTVEVPRSLLGLVDDIRARVIASLKDRRVASSHVAVSNLNTCVYRIDALKAELAPRTTPEPQTGEREIADLLAETGCASLDDLKDKANIGVSLMNRIADLCKPGSRHEHWSPLNDPAEIVFDLDNALHDAERRLAEVKGRMKEADDLPTFRSAEEAVAWFDQICAEQRDDHAALHARPEARDIVAKGEDGTKSNGLDQA